MPSFIFSLVPLKINQQPVFFFLACFCCLVLKGKSSNNTSDNNIRSAIFIVVKTSGEPNGFDKPWKNK